MALPTAEQLRLILAGDGYERVSDAYIRGLEYLLMKQQEEASEYEESERPVRTKKKAALSFIPTAHHSPNRLSNGMRKTDVVTKHLAQKKRWDEKKRESDKIRKSAVWETRYRMLSAGSSIYHYSDPVASYTERMNYQQGQPLLDEKVYNQDRRSLLWETRCRLLEKKPTKST